MHTSFLYLIPDFTVYKTCDLKTAFWNNMNQYVKPKMKEIIFNLIFSIIHN